MSDGFVAHYTTPVSTVDALASLAALEDAGLAIENALTKIATLLDDEGDQLGTDRAGLVRAVANAAIGQRVTFQIWISDSVDMICSYTRLAERLAVRRYLLDGLLSDEAELAIAAVSSQVGLGSPKTIGFVVDRRGVAAETDLDQIIRDGAGSRVHPPVDVFLMG